MFKLDTWNLEKAEEPEIKSPTSVISLKKQENSRKKICIIDYTKAFGSVDYNKTLENSSRDGNTRPA